MNTKEAAATVTLKFSILVIFFCLFAFVFLAVFVLGWLLF